MHLGYNWLISQRVVPIPKDCTLLTLTLDQQVRIFYSYMYLVIPICDNRYTHTRNIYTCMHTYTSTHTHIHMHDIWTIQGQSSNNVSLYITLFPEAIKIIINFEEGR